MLYSLPEASLTGDVLPTQRKYLAGLLRREAISRRNRALIQVRLTRWCDSTMKLNLSYVFNTILVVNCCNIVDGEIFYIVLDVTVTRL